MIIEKWLSLTVFAHSGPTPSEGKLAICKTWNRDENGEDEKGGHNSKSKDPLEGNDFGEELADTKG